MIPNTPNGRFGPPVNPPAPPQTQMFSIYLRGPGNDGLQPVAKIGHVSAPRALLAFISQIGGDEFAIREIKIVKEVSSLIVPA